MYREGYEVRLFYFVPAISTDIADAVMACLRQMQTRNFFALCEEEEWWWGGSTKKGIWREGVWHIIAVEARVPFSEDFLRQERIIMRRSGGMILVPGDKNFWYWANQYEKFVYPDEWKKKHQKS